MDAHDAVDDMCSGVGNKRKRKIDRSQLCRSSSQPFCIALSLVRVVIFTFMLYNLKETLTSSGLAGF